MLNQALFSLCLVGKDVPPPSPPTNGQKWRRADTNVIAVKFDHLTAPSNMHTGDAVVCKSCSAILSKLSKVEHRQDNKVSVEIPEYSKVYFVCKISFDAHVKVAVSLLN